jgi:hypothetical protein
MSGMKITPTKQTTKPPRRQPRPYFCVPEAGVFVCGATPPPLSVELAFGIGYRTVMTGGIGVMKWVYDQRRRAMEETRHLNGLGDYTTGTTYDAMDRLVTMTYPDSEVITSTTSTAT